MFSIQATYINGLVCNGLCKAYFPYFYVKGKWILFELLAYFVVERVKYK